MTVTFLTVGSPSRGWVADGVDHYTRFLSKYATVELLAVKPVTLRGTDADTVRKVEAVRLLAKAAKLTGVRIACDANGTSFTSETFATALRQQLDHHSGRAIVMIGGPYGLGKSVLRSADLVWSFGPATLPHELALLTAMEQIARAFSILRGESYHK